MTLPKDPKKREIYLQGMKERGKARAADPKEKARLQEMARKRLEDPEIKKKTDDRRREAFQKPEVKENMSKAQKKWRKEMPQEEYEEKKQNHKKAMGRPEVREKLREAANKRFEDPEQRKLTSEATKAAMARPEVKAKVSEKIQRQWDNPETRAIIMDGFAKRWERPGEREKISIATKAAMPAVIARPGYKESVAAGIAANKKFSGTDIEVIVEKLLQSLGIEFEAQKPIGWYVVDFYIPSKNLVVECDGDYWHSIPKVKVRDGQKDTYLTRRGYKMLRILGKDIHNGKFDELYQILEVIPWVDL